MEIEILDGQDVEYLEQELDESTDTCRICLTETPSLLISISVPHKEKTIAGLINYVAGVTVEENDEYPQFVCQECLEHMEVAYKIKQKCINSDNKLRSQLKEINIKREIEDEEQYIHYVDYDDDEDYKPSPKKIKSVPVKKEVPKKVVIEKEVKPLCPPQEVFCKNCNQTFPSKNSFKKHSSECTQMIRFCEVCKEIIKGKMNFVKHIKEHKDNDDTPIDQCEQCLEKFYTRENAERHKCVIGEGIVVKRESASICYLCDEEYENRKSLFWHITKAHKKDGIFICPIMECESKIAYTPKTFYYHIESHFNPTSIPCRICGEVFIDRYLHYLHERDHKAKAIFTCDYCGKDLQSKDLLLKHIQIIHLLTRSHPCEQCGCSFSTDPQLQRHRIKEHGAKGTHRCEVCGTWFLQKSSLKYHMKSHVERPMVPCELCNQEFKHNLDLQRHVELAHMRKTNYQCDICLKYFHRGYDLTCHKRIHTGDKRHGCSVCGMRFLTKSALVTHMRVHTGEMPYPCYMCEKRFRDHRGVRSHLKNFHKIENPNTKNLMERSTNVAFDGEHNIIEIKLEDV